MNDFLNMDKKYEIVKKIILAFEDNKITAREALKAILENTGKNLTESDLLNYWRSTELDSYVKRLIAVPISDWQQIDDKRALELIMEIFSNIGDDAIFEVNAEALEKRYSKSSGIISDWIFHSDIDNPHKILSLLKTDTTIIL